MMSKKVLIIEDDIPIQELYCRVFTKHNWRVICAVTGAEAFKKAKNIKFNMILLDIMLPDKNGVDVLKDIRAKKSPWVKTPVFMLTNLGQPSIIKESLKRGAQGYLLKARLLPKQIVEKVEDFLQIQANSPQK